MTDKTFRDELALAADVEGFDCGSTEEAARFVGIEVPDENDFSAMAFLSMAVNAKLRYMYADAMLKARGSEAVKAEEWIPFNGEEMPLDIRKLVDVKFRDGAIAEGRGIVAMARQVDRGNQGSESDVVAWRFVR